MSNLQYLNITGTGQILREQQVRTSNSILVHDCRPPPPPISKETNHHVQPFTVPAPSGGKKQFVQEIDDPHGNHLKNADKLDICISLRSSLVKSVLMLSK